MNKINPAIKKVLDHIRQAERELDGVPSRGYKSEFYLHVSKDSLIAAKRAVVGLSNAVGMEKKG